MFSLLPNLKYVKILSVKVLISLLLISFQVQASESCTATDNRNAAFYNSEGQEIMRNQAGSDWCYAYFTADMYSHRLAKTQAGRELLQNQMISPMSFLINPDNKPKVDQTADDTAFTILTSGGANPTELSTRVNARELPLCLESDLPSHVLGTTEVEGVKDTLHIFNTLQDLDNLLGTTKFTPLTDSVVCESWLNDFSGYFGNVDFSSFRGILAQTQQYGVNSHTGSLLLTANCQTNINSQDLNIPEMQVQSFEYDSEESRAAYIAKLNQVLDTGDIAGLSYNSDFLMGRPVPEDRRLGHISSIVARRCLGNQAQYLIRNSWGDSCRSYSEEIQTRCENGNIWVTSDELLRISNEITFFQDN
jgi:hypothetical protein